MNTYAVTINPSPYKKWDLKLVNFYFSSGRIYCKNYDKLPRDIQEKLLKDILDYLVKRASYNAEWSDFIFEDTKLNNRHIHVYFKAEKNMQPMKSKIVQALNDVFGCSEANHHAVYIEETTDDKRYWQDYMKKEQYLEKLMNLKLDPYELDISN